MCFAPVLTMSEAAEHPHNVEREHLHRDRRRASAGAGAAVLAHRRRSRRRRRHIRGSTPAKCWQTGAWLADRIDALIAVQGRGRRLMGTLVCFHAHPDDEAITTGGIDGPCRRRRPPRGAGGRHQRRSRRGARRSRPTARRWSIGVASRAARSAEVLGVHRRGLARLPRLRHDRLGAERPRRVVPAGPGRRGRRAAWPTSCATSRPTCSPPTTGTATTATPTTSRCTASVIAPPSWRARRRCSRPR